LYVFVLFFRGGGRFLLVGVFGVFVKYSEGLLMNANFVVFNRAMLVLLISVFVSGCATSGFSKMKDGALELIGMVKPEEKTAADSSKNIRVHIYAGSNLNTDERGRPMAVVLRIYRLRDVAEFMQAPYEALADGAQGKALLANDLLEVKEFVVTPGQELLRDERLGGDASYLGVVAFFRKPHPERWRLVFAADQKLNAGGITLGAHACALTVAKGVPFNAQLVSAGSLGGVLCH
jgi:type VI secretion system protein VasD